MPLRAPLTQRGAMSERFVGDRRLRLSGQNERTLIGHESKSL